MLDKETELRKKHTQERKSAFTGEAPKNPHHIISEETRFLDQIRDIRDELHILKSLAEDQDVVWKQAFPATRQRNPFKYNHPYTPTDVKSDLDEMILEAETTQNSVSDSPTEHERHTNYVQINTLLDLRQKQASLIEAENGRKQANDTARQSNSVFVFTLITIIFVSRLFREPWEPP